MNAQEGKVHSRCRVIAKLDGKTRRRFKQIKDQAHIDDSAIKYVVVIVVVAIVVVVYLLYFFNVHI